MTVLNTIVLKKLENVNSKHVYLTVAHDLFVVVCLSFSVQCTPSSASPVRATTARSEPNAPHLPTSAGPRPPVRAETCPHPVTIMQNYSSVPL